MQISNTRQNIYASKYLTRASTLQLIVDGNGDSRQVQEYQTDVTKYRSGVTGDKSIVKVIG